MDPQILALLACPLEPSRPALELKGDYLVCQSCQTAFPIVDGIPHLLPESGVPLDSIQKESNEH